MARFEKYVLGIPGTERRAGRFSVHPFMLKFRFTAMVGTAEAQLGDKLGFRCGVSTTTTVVETNDSGSKFQLQHQGKLCSNWFRFGLVWVLIKEQKETLQKVTPKSLSICQINPLRLDRILFSMSVWLVTGKFLLGIKVYL